MFSYDIRRFSPDLTRNADWVRQRSHEAYAKNYSIVYPHDEPLASRKMKKSAIAPLLEKAGCVFQERHGWERPGWFSPAGIASIQQYDWYGAYGNAINEDQAYVERLKEDYTFGFPKNHSIVNYVNSLLEIIRNLSPFFLNRLSRNASGLAKEWRFS